MRATATFDVLASPDEVAVYLSKPRNILIANHKGPVVEQSEPPVRAGSWAVLALDQLRVRVEYTEFEPPTLVAARITYSGVGSGGMRGSVVYHLGPTPGTNGTRVALEAESSGGWTPDLIGQLLWPLMWRRLRSRIETRLRSNA